MRRSRALDLARLSEQLLAGRLAQAFVALLGVVALVGGVLINPAAGAVVVVAGLLIGAVTIAVVVLSLTATSQSEGPYEVDEDRTEWDIEADDGSRAVVIKVLKVRFTQSAVVIQDEAWGDGDLFANYHHNVGTLLKVVDAPPRKYAIVQLVPPRTTGEPVELVSRRTVADGFRGADEWVQLGVANPSLRSEMVVRFPPGRPPQNVRVKTERDNVGRPPAANELGHEDGRTVFRRTFARPKVGTTLTVNWSW